MIVCVCTTAFVLAPNRACVVSLTLGTRLYCGIRKSPERVARDHQRERESKRDRLVELLKHKRLKEKKCNHGMRNVRGSKKRGAREVMYKELECWWWSEEEKVEEKERERERRRERLTNAVSDEAYLRNKTLFLTFINSRSQLWPTWTEKQRQNMSENAKESGLIGLIKCNKCKQGKEEKKE